jgi:N utilization substance protein B
VSRGRTRARRCAVQALYQWQLAGQQPKDILGEFVAERELVNVDLDYFSKLALEIPAAIGELDAQLQSVLDRPNTELNPVERAILWLGTFELLRCPDVPYRVVVNEAVELAKIFGAEQAYRYVNANLDKLARSLRAAEISTT